MQFGQNQVPERERTSNCFNVRPEHFLWWIQWSQISHWIELHFSLTFLVQTEQGNISGIDSKKQTHSGHTAQVRQRIKGMEETYTNKTDTNRYKIK